MGRPLVRPGPPRLGPRAGRRRGPEDWLTCGTWGCRGWKYRAGDCGTRATWSSCTVKGKSEIILEYGEAPVCEECHILAYSRCSSHLLEERDTITVLIQLPPQHPLDSVLFAK